MRVTSPRLPLALLLAASAFALTGCSPEAAVPSAPPSAEAEPLFASDEEALAAAEAAFARYLDVAFDVFSAGGESPERLEEVAVGDALQADLDRASQYAEQGLRQTGDPVIIQSELQQYIPDASDQDEVIIYSCLDGTSIELLGADGESRSDPNRSKTITVENRFVADESGVLLLADSEVWADGDSCEF